MNSINICNAFKEEDVLSNGNNILANNADDSVISTEMINLLRIKIDISDSSNNSKAKICSESNNSKQNIMNIVNENVPSINDYDNANKPINSKEDNYLNNNLNSHNPNCNIIESSKPN